MKKIIVVFICLFLADFSYAGNYKNFRATAYITVGNMNKMNDQAWLESTWKDLSKNVKLDKVYLETFRDMVFVNEKALQNAIKFFKSKGVEMSGGITFNRGGGNRMRWESFCYNDPEQRKIIKQVSELTAKYFNEIVLDDYYFTNCKCDLCIAAKGDKSWSEFRTKLLDDAAKELIVGPAHKVNSNCHVIVKYPNWYEHFQGLGFDLEHGPYTFDGVYTGTETRDPSWEQHLQPYESFAIVRYYENLRPRHNYGGWVDTGSLAYFDMFPEQLWMTLLAKAPEITLFNFGGMAQQFRETPRAWENENTTFNMSDMKTKLVKDGVKESTWGSVAGYSFRQVDKMLGALGTPKGIKSYKPFNSIGEDFLVNYLGTAGIPIELVPTFPEDAEVVLLTETAKYDPAIVSKIKNHLKKGNDVVITSGLFRALQGKGIEDIVEMVYTDRKADVDTILIGGRREPAIAKAKIKIPEFTYMTNDSWEDISTLDYGNGWPLLQQIAYSNGNMFVLVVPENFSHIYALPDKALNRIRTIMTRDVDARIEGPAQVALFTYDNGTLAVESFHNEPVTIKIVTNKSNSLTDIVSGEKIFGQTMNNEKVYGRGSSEVTKYTVTIQPHSINGFVINYK